MTRGQQQLVRHFETLTRRYLLDAASERFWIAYQRYVLELHVKHLRPLSVEWLEQLYTTAVRNGPAVYSPRKYVSLLRYLVQRSDLELLVADTLSRISASAQQAEAVWEWHLLEAGYPAAVHEDLQDNLNSVVQQLNLEIAYQEVRNTLQDFFDFIIAMTLATPVRAADAMCDCMAGPDYRVQFLSVAGANIQANPVTIPSIAIFEERLRQAFGVDSGYWLACARAALASMHRDARIPTQHAHACNYLFGSQPARRATAYMHMLRCCLDVVAPALDATTPGPLLDPVIEPLLGETLASSGIVLADVAAEHAGSSMRLYIVPPRARARPTSPFALDYAVEPYRAVAMVLTATAEGDDGAQPARKLQEFVAPLKAPRHRDLRVHLLGRCRFMLETARSERQSAHAIQDWRAIAAATVRLHAMQHLLAALKLAS